MGGGGRQGGPGVGVGQPGLPRPGSTPAPVRTKLTAPLTTIFQDKARPETEHTLATNILADYASDDPEPACRLLMVADPKAYREPLPDRRAKRAEQVCPFSRPSSPGKPRTPGTIRRSIHPGRNPTPALDEPDRVGTGDARRAVRLLPDDAAGRVPHDRRGAPQIGIPPRSVPSLCRWARRQVAAVWTRDGRNWRSHRV